MTSIQMKGAVVLLSGGIDSTTTLAIAIAEGYKTYALSFDYGQRHQIETEAARRVANSLGAKEHRIAKIDLRVFGGSALTDDVAVPKQRLETEIAHGIPVTYVPARNTIFLAYALAWAEVIPANDIFIGVNAIDYSGYPDCRPEFIKHSRTWPMSERKPASKADASRFTRRSSNFPKPTSFAKQSSSASIFRSPTVVTIRHRKVSPAANAIPVFCGSKASAKPESQIQFATQKNETSVQDFRTLCKNEQRVVPHRTCSFTESQYRIRRI